MVKRLTRLRIEEVSSVDAGAGRGVKVMLMKRDADANKRTFSAEERRRDAANHDAMPGGRYPIETVQDLHNAIRAVGRGKGSHAAIRRHIISRARALGAMSAIPEDWKVSKGLFGGLKKMLGFEEPTVADVLSDTHEALFKSVSEIIKSDADREVKIGEMRKLFDEAGAHLTDALPESFSKALADAGFDSAALNNPGDVRKEKPMADDDRREEEDEEKARKAREDAEREEAEEKARKAREAEDEEKARKAREEAEEKARGMKDGSDVDKRFQTELAKRDAAMEEVRKANEEMRKRLEALEAEKGAIAFAKQATDMGLPPAFGEVIRKTYAGDKAAIDSVFKHLAALTKQVDEGALFSEFGKMGNGVSNDPMDQIDAKAAELRKADPSLTKEQAFAKAYEANPDLAIAERRANRPG